MWDKWGQNIGIKSSKRYQEIERASEREREREIER